MAQIRSNQAFTETSELQIIDRQRFLELTDPRWDSTGGQLFSHLVDIYRTTVPRRLANLRLALSRGDKETARIEIHTLKSINANLGVRRAEHSFREFERLCVRCEPENLESLVAVCENHCRQALTELTTIQSDLKK